MANTTTLTTVHTGFFTLGAASGDKPLLSVEAGIPVSDALFQALSFLGIVIAVLYEHAGHYEKDSEPIYGAIYLAEVARALLLSTEKAA